VRCLSLHLYKLKCTGKGVCGGVNDIGGGATNTLISDILVLQMDLIFNSICMLSLARDRMNELYEPVRI